MNWKMFGAGFICSVSIIYFQRGYWIGSLIGLFICGGLTYSYIAELRKNNKKRAASEKPFCAIGGIFGPRAICGAYLLGTKRCDEVMGRCQHQREQPPKEPKNE